MPLPLPPLQVLNTYTKLPRPDREIVDAISTLVMLIIGFLGLHALVAGLRDKVNAMIKKQDEMLAELHAVITRRMD